MKNSKLLIIPAAVYGLLAGGIGQAEAKSASAASKDAQIEALTRRLELLERKLEERESAPSQSATTSAASVESPAVKQLEQKVKLLERKQEVEREVAEAEAKKKPRIEDSPGAGLKITSADGQHQLRLRGYAQADGRFFVDDQAENDTDTFTIRRARLNFDGTLFKYNDFRIAPDFAGNSPSLFDAYLDLHYFPFASLTAGKQKTPIGLERLQSATALTFAERAYPTQLQGNREIGIMLHGEFAKPGYETVYGGPHSFNDFFAYQVGVFNGGADNESPANSTSAKFD
ncbi:MAG: hypothetical protein H6R26_1986, partial [Proteobacteria bacterium]|nr:hypothetical protein [Pseudomonadota bacterium]